MSDQLRIDVMTERKRIERRIAGLNELQQMLEEAYLAKSLLRVDGEGLKWQCPHCGRDAEGSLLFINMGDRLAHCGGCDGYYVVGSRVVDERRAEDRRRKKSDGRRTK